MIHLIHGIHTEPTSHVKGLVGYLVEAGLEVSYPDYGFEWALETRLVNTMIEGALFPYIDPGDVLVGHSNGCAMAYHLALMGAPVKGLVLINGALETTIRRPGSVEWIDVYFNPGDTITEAAALGERLGLVDPLWGELGHAGYSGDDKAIVPIDCSATPNMPRVWGHSDFFTPAPQLKAWGPYSSSRIKAKL